MIAKYPPMGWNSWDCYGAAVKEETVRKNAEYMAKNLRSFGWEYIVVDIEWYQPTASSHAYEPFSELVMDPYGRLFPAENRFPSAAGGKGFAPLAEYVHSLGLQFGIHIMRGLPRMAAHHHLPVLGTNATCAEIANPNSICAWNPDMYGIDASKKGARAYYESLFNLYAGWGVDFVKVDDIAREYPHCKDEIELISAACQSCGRDMVLSLSPGPAPLEQAEHLKKHANMWRITDDFWDEWRLLKAMFERAEKWCIHAGAGHWPDADMLPLGAIRQNSEEDNWTRFTEDEQVTLLTLWCMMRSPLMFGGELTKADAFTRNLITNAAVLEIIRETHCAHPLYTTENEAAWIAPRTEGEDCYVALFNLSDDSRTIRLDMENQGLPDYHTAVELWTNKTYACAKEINTAVNPHGAAVFRLSRSCWQGN